MMVLKRAIILISFIILAMQTAYAVDISAKIKASYIYNFLQFITFNDSALKDHAKLNVCIVGQNYFGTVLNKIEGESTPQAKLHIVYLGDFTDTLPLKSCNVVYLTKSAQKYSQKVLSIIDNKEIVTIAEYSPFVADGGLIELFSDKGKILFRINTNLVKESHYKVAAQLIQLGRN